MSNVMANLSMSLDGFTAYPDDGVGGLFDWYRAGDVSVAARRLPGGSSLSAPRI